jgi:hypothetical protein
MKVRIMGGLLFAVLLGGDLLLSPELLLPFHPLGDRIRLIAYTNYAAIAALIPFLGGSLFVVVHQLFHPRKDIREYAVAYHSMWMKIIWVTLAVVLIAISARFYLGYKVDQAGYVKCIHESRTSTKSSWRVYAKSLSLCKSSSGIAGG